MQFGYTNPNDTEGIMDLISGSSQIVLFVTGRGSVIGSPMAPLIKITGNSQTYQRMIDDMDFDAGRILSGELRLMKRPMNSAIWLSVLCGESRPGPRPWHRASVMYKHQDTPTLESGCRA